MTLYIIVNIRGVWHVKSLDTLKTVAVRETQEEALNLMERLNYDPNQRLGTAGIFVRRTN